MHDFVIVGAGLFGQIIRKEFIRLGMKGIIIDNMRPLGGSSPSAGLMKPSWFAKQMKNEHEGAFLCSLDGIAVSSDMSRWFSPS